MKIKKKYLYIILPAVLIAAALPVKVPHKVYSTGRIFPKREWILGRTSDGRITSTIRDNQLGVISSYGGKEFKQGDVFDFDMDPQLARKRYVHQGERVGGVESSELKRMLAELEGQLKVENATLNVYSTGEKVQIVQEAQTSSVLAKEQLEIKKKLLARKKKLYEDSLIAPQDYDLALNEYETARISYELARARFNTVSTGEKPEQLRLSRQRIVSLQSQILTLKERLKSLEIRAPFSGLLLYKKAVPSLTQTNTPYVDILADVADTSEYIVVTPVQLKDARYLQEGQVIMVRPFNSDREIQAEVSNIDNVIQIVNGKQAMFVTGVVRNRESDLLPGIVAQTAVITGEVTVYEYLGRFFEGLFFR